MATAIQVESLWNGLEDNNGNPLAGGKVYTYYAGTTTPVSLFTASDKSLNATNPLILDGYGRAQVYADGRYKFVVKTSADVTLYTLDNLIYGFDESVSLYAGESGGSANAQTVSVVASVLSYSAGQRLTFVAGYTNTGALTLNVNGIGAVSVVKGADASPLAAGDVRAGQLVDVVYEAESGSGRFRLMDFPSAVDVQNSRFLWGGTSGGSKNAQTITPSPSVLSYQAGQVFRFIAGFTTDSSATLNVGGLGAKTIKRYGTALVGGEIQLSDVVEVVYDGTDFQLVASIPSPLFIDRTNGKLGINNTTPAYLVDAQSTAQAFLQGTLYANDGNGPVVNLRKSRGGSIGTNAIVLDSDIAGAIQFQGATGSSYSTGARIRAIVHGSPGVGDMPMRLSFETSADGTEAPLERLTVTSTGRVGIKTNNPGAMLSVQGTASNSPDPALQILGGASNSLTTYPALGAGSFNGMAVAGDVGLLFSGGAVDTGALLIAPWSTAAVGCGLRVANNGSTTIKSSNPAGTAFAALAQNATTAAAQFYIGVASSQSHSPVFIDKYDANTTGNAFIQFRVNAGTAVANSGQIASNGSGQAAFVNQSDRRLKENIENLPPQLGKICSLRPCEFDYKDGSGHQIGFIAQEVRDVYPDLVSEGAEGYLLLSGLNKTEARLIKAIQELEARVAALEGR